MKNIRRFLLAAVALFAVCSCEEEKIDSGVPAGVQFKARLEASPIGSLSLVEGAKLDIYDSRHMASEFTIDGLSGKNVATVSGKLLTEDSYTAVWPADANNSWNGKTLTVRLDAYQNAVHNGIEPKNCISFSNFRRTDGAFTLTTAVSYVALQGDFGDAKVTGLILTADHLISGKAEISNRGGELQITPVSGSKSVKIRSAVNEIESSKRYIIAIWPGEYRNVVLTAESSTGKVQKIEIGDITAARNSLIAIPAFTLQNGKWEDGDTEEVGGGPYKFAEGTLKWSDGTPAEGISVSDGFRVAVTDSKGYYRLDTSNDTYYIYFSYPSDAKISTRLGCPDFFRRYDNMTREYDFTLEKQAVENEFAFFAMADPQAHYAARSPQKVADTYRFDRESVPAINNQILAQNVPCYGVTLGDIVYSEGSRNSNNGLSTMRNSFGKINMPVFQTFGNHDYSYFHSSAPLATDEHSSTLNLKSARAFEEVFGPVNYSFNRGNVHVVVMKNVQYESTTDASKYHCGYTDEQWEWLKADLANVPKTKAVILCGHIPLLNNSAYHVSDVINLIKSYPGSTIFSGHTHYYRGYPNVQGSGMYEHIHSAVCGQWWWSKIEGDGCPNGYTVYRIRGKEIDDAYFIGVNEGMDSRDYQMRIYRGNITNGGSYAYFKWGFSNKTLLINVFNGDERWNVEVKENGVSKGSATLMSNSKKTYSSVTAGSTYNVPTTSNQDWWAIGYHIGEVGRGRSSTSYYTNMFHMWKYEMSDANAGIEVIATDPYGNKYSCTEVIGSDCSYPSYIKIF